MPGGTLTLALIQEASRLMSSASKWVKYISDNKLTCVKKIKKKRVQRGLCPNCSIKWIQAGHAKDIIQESEST